MEGHQLTGGGATISSQVVQDVGGNPSIVGVVTGNTRKMAGPLERGYEIAARLVERAKELGFKAYFEEGGHTPDYHSEGIHQLLLRQLSLTPVGSPYMNKSPCGPQCAAAQEALDAIILEVTRGAPPPR